MEKEKLDKVIENAKSIINILSPQSTQVGESWITNISKDNLKEIIDSKEPYLFTWMHLSAAMDHLDKAYDTNPDPDNSDTSIDLSEIRSKLSEITSYFSHQSKLL